MTRRGTNLPQSKLSEHLVQVVRDLHAAGISTRRLGKALGVHHTTIWYAVRSYPALLPDGKFGRRHLAWDHVR